MNPTLEHDRIRQTVRARYGEIAEHAGTGCCGGGCAPQQIGYSDHEAASAPAGSAMGLGCGNPTALASIQPGETILDLGSGGGFDCFLAARQTGPGGRVIGVDMTPEMVSKARTLAAEGGYDQVEFRLGEIEALPVADGSIDLIVSNCVINLSPDKHRVFREAFRVLRGGGRLALSDIVQLRPLPESLGADFQAYTGCVAGASNLDDLRHHLEAAGFTDIGITVHEASRAFINEWLPGKNAGDYVASAAITARKPTPTRCCGH